MDTKSPMVLSSNAPPPNTITPNIYNSSMYILYVLRMIYYLHVQNIIFLQYCFYDIMKIISCLYQKIFIFLHLYFILQTSI